MGRRKNVRYLVPAGLLFMIALIASGIWAGSSPVLSANAAALASSLSAAPRVPADGTESLPSGATIQTLLTGMTKPIAMAFDPQGRLFYTEKETGNVRLFANGVLQANPVITYSVDGTCSERGLLGIAIDPNFTTNHYIYVYYTQNPGSSCGATTNRIARFVENNGVGSGSVDIFTSTQTAGNHNGGNIHFGPDGKLYISIGDNANAANSQDVTVKNGKIHRINSDGTIPAGNPVFTQTGALPSLYAMGVRNTFDFTFDPYTPGRIFASENGPSCDDEMNRIVGGYNYGWRASYPCDDPNPSPTYNTIPPLWYLGNGACCQAPTGIVVYNGSQLPTWQGGLFMATYSNSGLRHFYLNADRTAVTATNIVQGVSVGTDLEVGPDGAFWYIEGGGYSAGTLKRIVGLGGSATPTITNTPPATSTPMRTNTPTATPTVACPPQTVEDTIQNFAFVPQTLTVSVGTSIRWTNFDLDYHTSTSSDGLWDSGNIQQNQSYTFTFTTPGTYQYYCRPHPYMTGTITVLPDCQSTGDIAGHLTWQGIPQPDTRNNGITATLTLCINGNPVSYPVTTDQNGNFTVQTGMSGGTYGWWLKGTKSLANSGSITLSGGTTNMEVGTMRAGDANNSNIVSSADFNIVKQAFGGSADLRADFNNDGIVNAQDFNLLKGVFGQSGAPANCP